VEHAQLAQAPLGVLVVRGHQADDRHPGDRQAAERLPVEAPQVGRQQGGLRLARGRGGQQVGQVDAAPHHGDAEVASLQGGHELRLPPRVADGGQDGHGHQPAPEAGESRPEDSTARGTRTRSMVPSDIAETRAETSVGRTCSSTGVLERRRSRRRPDPPGRR
jgi:hypothetical protein